jgi:hypothetical protein
MSDDPNKRGEPDRSRINHHEDYEVAYWTKELGVTKEELVAAIRKVGPMAEDVRRELKK